MVDAKNLTLGNYVRRYRTDLDLLAKHPEKEDLLGRRILQHKEDIIKYVTSDYFISHQLACLNL